MIVFCDTSALMKLYVAETGTDALKRLADAATAVAICRVTWAEAHATLSRRARESPIESAVLQSVKRALAADWPQFLVVDVTQQVVERAGDFAETFALRGYDSMQLAAGHRTAEMTADAVTFAAFDRRLNRAAATLGMQAPFAEAF